jgi:hypothetical protein
MSHMHPWDMELGHLYLLPRNQPLRAKHWSQRLWARLEVTVRRVPAHDTESVGFDAEQHAHAAGLAGLDFDTKGRAIEEPGGKGGLARVGGGAAWERAQRGVVGRAVEGGEEGEGEGVDGGVFADSAEGEESGIWI